jgi:hypothetical protein
MDIFYTMVLVFQRAQMALSPILLYAKHVILDVLFAQEAQITNVLLVLQAISSLALNVQHHVWMDNSRIIAHKPVIVVHPNV